MSVAMVGRNVAKARTEIGYGVRVREIGSERLPIGSAYIVSADTEFSTYGTVDVYYTPLGVLVSAVIEGAKRGEIYSLSIEDKDAETEDDGASGAFTLTLYERDGCAQRSQISARIYPRDIIGRRAVLKSSLGKTVGEGRIGASGEYQRMA